MLGGKFGLNIIRVDASKRFLDLLADVEDPEKKRKIIGNEFVYGQPGVSGHYGVGPHDKTIIEDSAGASGLIRNDDNMYENI
ncbi:hypothetical protein, partial [Streptococcus pyogenes]|uniref:hypothetical protein n=1 Tax=Streptococcus pyogenes TaxID=1314 RepID=UPI000FF859A8